MSSVADCPAGNSAVWTVVPAASRANECGTVPSFRTVMVTGMPAAASIIPGVIRNSVSVTLSLAAPSEPASAAGLA